MAAREAPAQAVRRDCRDHGGDHGRQAHQRLCVVPRDDRLQHGQVTRSRGIVGERPFDDVRERALGGGDDGGLFDVERSSPERHRAKHEREHRAGVGERSIGDGEKSSHEIVRTAGRISGVCRHTHRTSR
jgi:hypothetical protein